MKNKKGMARFGVLSRELTVGLRILLFSLFVALIISLPFFVNGIFVLRKLDQSLARAQAVHVGMARIQSAIWEATASQRAFLLSGRETRLRPYVAAVQLLKRESRSLSYLLRDQAEARQKLKDVEVQIELVLQALRGGIEERRRLGLREDRAIALVDAGRADLEGLRLLVDDLRQSQRQIVEEGRRERAAYRFWVGVLFVGINVLALVLALVAYFFVFPRIRDQVRAAESLRESEERYRVLTEVSPQIVWTADARGKINYYNQSWVDLTGLTLQQSLGSGWMSVMHPEDRDHAMEGWRRAVRRQDHFQEELRFLRASDGQYRWHLTKAFPVWNSQGHVSQWIGVAMDIQEQKSAQEALKTSRSLAEQANFSKTRFLANMSHEIRTPIGAITGFLDLMKNPGINRQEFLNYAAIISRNSDQLLRLIDDILDLSKVEAGRMTIEKVAFSLTDLLEEMASVMTFKAREKGIDFVLDRQGSLPRMVLSDPIRVRQILANIVGNAIKFTEHGSVRLEIRADGSRFHFLVTDTGRGISSAQAGSLFQPFMQADLSTTRKYGGTGLGLVLSRKLAELLGGHVKLQKSEVGKGTVFEIVLVMDLVAGEHEQPESPLNVGPGTSEENALEGLRILLVEDSPDNQILVSTFLRRAGGLVDTAWNGIEGMERALSGDYDVVLMDVQMPFLDGLEATRRLRRDGYSRPIIALTAHALPEERHKSLEAGCSDHVTKPVHRENLIKVVRRYASQLRKLHVHEGRVDDLPSC